MRECGDCTLCCKLPAIKDFKDGYKWCENCNIGKGCNIYETRPKPCIDFDCMWKDNCDARQVLLYHFLIITIFELF